MTKPKDVILIFSASTGGGHNAAAKSLQKGLMERNYDAKVIDAFAESSPALNRLLTHGYKNLVENLPKLYHTFYFKFDKMTKNQQMFFNIITRIMNPEILPMIYEEKPVLLVSTHPFVTNKLGTLKKNGAFDIPILSFVTDYKIHGFYINPIIDAYVVGSQYTKDDMIRRGVPENIIYPFGIPVRESFIEETKSPEIIDKTVRGTILMMAGSLGCNQMEKAFVAVMKAEQKLKIIVVCGNNKSMERDLTFLKKVYKTNSKNVEIHGFVNNIPTLMDESDVIISKPGGLTTTEAMIKGIPMLIPYYYPGQEEENVDFLVESGMGIKIDRIKDLTLMVDFLIENKYIIQEMSENMTEEAQKLSSISTLDLCENLISNYKKSGGNKIKQEVPLYKVFD